MLFPITRRVSAFNVKTNLTFFRFNDSFVFCFFAPHHEEEAAFTKRGKSVAFRQTAGTVSRRRSTPDLPVRARSGSSNWIHLLARSGSGNQIHLPLSLYKLCAVYICISVSSCHPKANEPFDTSFSTFHQLRLVPKFV